MQVDANEVIRELSERLARQEVELATLRVLLRQQSAPEPETDLKEMNKE